MTSPSESYRRNMFGLALLIAAQVAIGLTVGNAYYLTVATLCMIFGIASVGLTIAMGYAGLISLGQSAFFGIGAYIAANLATRLNVEPVVALIIGSIGAAAVGWVIARPLLRLSGLYFAMASLAFGIVAYIFFAQLRGITGGLDPGFSCAAFSVFGKSLGDTHSMFWVSSVALVLIMFGMINLIHSRFGRALKALGGSEVAAAGVGVSVVAYKTMALAVAAGVTGVAGGLFAFFLRSFNASAFGFNLSIELLVMVIVGSLRSIWGALLGAAFVTILPSFLEGFENYKLFIYGLAMVVIMMIMPDGLFQAAIDAFQYASGRRKPA
jgi:branched-chain amino acid transport system permease protein